MSAAASAPELIAEKLGWPEGPAVLPDGSLLFVESYLSQLTVVGADHAPRRFAYTAGAPNSCVLGAEDDVYVCQNGGTVGPWRAAEMTEGPRIATFVHVPEVGAHGQRSQWTTLTFGDLVRAGEAIMRAALTAVRMVR